MQLINLIVLYYKIKQPENFNPFRVSDIQFKF